jgi:hypothetical protein
LVFKIAGSTLRVARIQEFTPSPFTILGWHVADLARAAAVLKKRGVRFERFPGAGQARDLGRSGGRPCRLVQGPRRQRALALAAPLTGRGFTTGSGRRSRPGGRSSPAGG